MIILIDNYDSFTYNLYHYLLIAGAEVEVRRNDKITIEEIHALNPSGIVISPGPATPDDAGICLNLIHDIINSNFHPYILGVCLGHQVIGQAFGGKIVRTTPFHGKVSKINHSASLLFDGVPKQFKATRYHSLIIERESLPSLLRVIAETDDGIIMAIEHTTLPIYGVQFHPESIASEYGQEIIRNFVKQL